MPSKQTVIARIMLVGLTTLSAGCAADSLPSGPAAARPPTQLTVCTPITGNEDRLTEFCRQERPGLTSRLANPFRIQSLAELRTWAGPDDHCPYKLQSPSVGETPETFYTRVVAPQAARRQELTGYPAYYEVDVDCVNIAMGKALLKAPPRTQLHAFGVAAQQMRTEGCASAATTLRLLEFAGRPSFSLARATHRNSGYPQALYLAAGVVAVCLADRPRAEQLVVESVRLGYESAAHSLP